MSQPQTGEQNITVSYSVSTLYRSAGIGRPNGDYSDCLYHYHTRYVPYIVRIGIHDCLTVNNVVGIGYSKAHTISN